MHSPNTPGNEPQREFSRLDMQQVNAILEAAQTEPAKAKELLAQLEAASLQNHHATQERVGADAFESTMSRLGEEADQIKQLAARVRQVIAGNQDK